MKLFRKLLLTGLVVGISGVIVLQKNAVATLRGENQKLQADYAETKTLSREREEAAKLRSDYHEAEELRAANRDLPKLRNEIGQLRRQKADLEALRAENQRLATAPNSKTPAPSIPIILAKESWTNAGMGSPEAALQTFFWAMREPKTCK